MTTAMLAKKLGLSEEKLESWENGEAKPTFKQAQNFAAKTYIPFGYLYLAEPPMQELQLPDLRTIGSGAPKKPSPELLSMVGTIGLRQEWYRDYLLDNDSIERFKPRNFDLHSSVEEVVEDMRRELQVSGGDTRGSWEVYFKMLIDLSEEAGILVMRQANLGSYKRKLLVSEFRGFALYDPVAPVIFINQSDSPNARLFTLVHELAHIWIGASGVSDAKPDSHRKEEALCNAIAGEFLVTATEILDYWRGDEDLKANLARLKARFPVSDWVIARRAQTLKLISLAEYQDYVEAEGKLYRARAKKSGGGNYYATKKTQISPRFARTLVREALSGRVLLREASELLNVRPYNIVKFSKELENRVST